MRCVKDHPTLSTHQRGAAVVLALITLFLCAALAAATVAQVGRSLDSATGQRDLAQARLLARAAVDWARNVLADDRLSTAVDHRGQPWAVRVPATPVGEAEVSGEIRCWSARFNVNMLVADGSIDERALAAFARLLQALDVPPAQAERLATTLAQHLLPPNPDDPDATDTPARGALVDTRQLAALPGFDTALVDRLSPLVAALPTPSRVNLNTAAPEVLVAVTGNLDLLTARALVAERERVWYRNVGDYTLRLPTGAALVSAQWVDVRSRHFLVTGRASFGTATVNLEALLDRAEVWPDILWQRLL